MSDMPANPANAFGNASANGPSGMGGVMVPLKIRVIRTNDVQHIDTITVYVLPLTALQGFLDDNLTNMSFSGLPRCISLI